MFVLSLSVFSCLLALTLGYLLAYGSGDAGAGVARHMWGAIALTIAVLALFVGPWRVRRFAWVLSLPAGLRTGSVGVDSSPGRLAHSW